MHRVIFYNHIVEMLKEEYPYEYETLNEVYELNITSFECYIRFFEL